MDFTQCTDALDAAANAYVNIKAGVPVDRQSDNFHIEPIQDGIEKLKEIAEL